MQQQAECVTETQIQNARLEKRECFLSRFFDLSKIEIIALVADASFRRYYRIIGADKAYLLMEDPTDRPPVPPLVMVEPFIKISKHLGGLGLSSPCVYEQNIEDGLLLIEDWGDNTYTNLLATSGDERKLYELATDVLIHLHQQEGKLDIELPTYSESAMLDEAMLLMDWYVPETSSVEITTPFRTEYQEIWKTLFKTLPVDQTTMVLRDYHVDNLIYLPNRQGVKACGLLDFQDALVGHYSYDLMSLLEDARREVPLELQKQLLERYFKGMGNDLDQERFLSSYRILAAQRHAKVVGIFVRLCKRDGKNKYLQFLPHVQNLLVKSMQTPIMKPLNNFFEQNNIDLTKTVNI